MKLFLDRVGQASIAILADKNRIIEVHSSEDNAFSIASIYVGRVYKIKKSINSAFLKINGNEDVYMPLNEKNIYHYVKNQNNSEKLCQGDEILVQILKYGSGEKLSSVSPNISLKSENFILLTDRKGAFVSQKISDSSIKSLIKTVLREYSDFNFGIIARTSAKNENIKDLEKELYLLINDYYTLIKKIDNLPSNATVLKVNEIDNIINELKRSYSFDIVSSYDIYSKKDKDIHIMNSMEYNELLLSYSIKDHLKKLFFKKILLNSGANIVIEKTEAMYVIDVNSHKSSMSKSNKKAILKNNLEAAEEIAHQIKSRNLAGIILIDFINMKEIELENMLIKKVEELSDNLGLGLTVYGLTKLSIMEITRKKESYSIYDDRVVKLWLEK